MPQKVRPIPEGYRTITPSIVVNDGARALEFYKRAFGATDVHSFTDPNGRVAHAEFRIGDSKIMLSDDFGFGTCKSPQALNGTTTNLWIYTEDVDEMFNRAVGAGATVKMPVNDMFWGDRFGQVSDPFGHVWSMATRKEEVSAEELKRRSDVEMAKMSQRTQKAT